MGDETITCRYVFTPTEFKRASRCFYRNAAGGWLWLWVAIVVVVILVVANTADSGSSETPPHPPANMPMAIMLNFLPVVLFIGLMIFLITYGNTWSFRRLPSYNQDMQYTLSAESIFLKTALFEIKVFWQATTRVAESKWGFMLLLKGKRSFHWFPKSGFESTEAVDAFRVLLRQHVADTKKLLS